MELKNQKGFTHPLMLSLVILLAGIIVFTGWYVWNSSQNADNSIDSADNLSETTGTKIKNTQQKSQSATKQSNNYLEIKQWGVKLPLGDSIKNAYYVLRASGPDTVESVELFDEDFDNLKNKNGVSCKDPDFPIYVISRIKEDNMRKIDPEFYSFVISKVMDGYQQSGQTSSQSPPACAELNPSSGRDFVADTTVTDRFQAIKNAFSEAYQDLEKI